MSTSSTIESTLSDAQAQIRELRRELDGLMSKRIEPAMREATKQAGQYAERASKMAQEEAEVAADYVRQRPFTTVIAAVAIGYLVARLTR